MLVSSKGTGATVTGRGGSNAYATVVTAGADALVSSSYGSIDVDCASTRAESINITLYGYDSSLAVPAQTITSNTVTYVCSSATVATVEVKVGKSDVGLSSTTTVDVVLKDANGLISPDGTTVALAVSGNGNVVLGGDTTTYGGSLDTKATFVSAPTPNVATVTAVSGGIVGSATITVGGGVDNATTATDAAAEATDAANAATDAANAAAEAADAATAAAQDAADAVAALSTQMAALIAQLKSQLTALTNLVIKIQKKVKA
jgi:flagellin-like hook-associated protein FlgL